MNTSPSRLFALVLISFVLAVTSQAAESLSVLLQKAIFAEETEGNLDAAIKIYEGIVKEGEANRSLVAQAQYRLGVCELKRGKKEQAEAAFRKIIGQFTDQSDVAAKARDRLGELGKSASSVVVRQVWSDPKNTAESVSLDGRHLAFIDWDTGNLAVRDLATGQTKRLTEHGAWNESQWAESCAFSRDGKQIAYGWYGRNDSYGLHVVSVEDAKSKTLIGQQTNRWIRAEDWSPDGKSIAVFDYEEQGTNWHGGISLISVADGAVRKVTALRGNHTYLRSNLRFSPDGRFLALNLGRNQRSSFRAQSTNDIFVVDVQTGTAKPAVEYFESEKFVGWSPRGSEILFTSERSGTTGLWSVEVRDGRDNAKPKMLKADLGNIEPIGLTRDGALFYSAAVGPLKEFYVASVDIEAGRMLSVPKLVRTTLERTVVTSLGDKAISSADGRFLFFRSGEKDPAAYILDLESGARREIGKSRAWAGRIGWWWPSPDNSALGVALAGPANEGGSYKVNTQTGEIAPLAVDGPGVRQMMDNPIRFRFDRDFVAYGRLYSNPKKFVLVKHDLKLGQETEYEIPGQPTDPIPQTPGSYGKRSILLSDGRLFLFNRKQSTENLNVVVCHDLVTGTQKEFLTSKSPVNIANDHNHLIFFVTTDDRERQVLTLYSFEDSELRQRNQVTVPEGFKWGGQHWGGPYLILKKTVDQEKGAPTEIWTLSVQTGELKKTDFSLPNDGYWDIPENGKSLLFQTATPASHEIWVMENFLPPTASKN